MSRDLVFSALGDAYRRLLLERLVAHGGLSLTELCEGVSISRQAVRKHIEVLEAADLVRAEKHGRVRQHFINPVPIHADALPWLQQFEDTPMSVLGHRHNPSSDA